MAIPAPGIALPRRRPQRHASPRRGPTRKVGRSKETRGIALRVIDGFEGISSSSLLDRLIRGRLWIGLLAFALIGIVAMQLLVLELNTGIGRKLARVAQLQLANAQLGIEDSGDSAEARVDPLAAAHGMTFAASGSLHFVAASGADVARAATVLATAVQSPAASGTESPSTAGGEASSPSGASSAGAETTSGSQTSVATTPSTSGEGASSETSSGASSAQEGAASTAGQAASSAGSSEAPSSSQVGGAVSAPAGTAAGAPGGGVQAVGKE
ncbi:MAG TPA: hypothetical protein VIG42_06050 [Solirubrobacteraceae bacterium]